MSEKTKMKLEDQVCSLELAKKLKELGMPQDSLFYWCSYTQFVDGELTTDWLLESMENVKRKGLDVGLVYSAFTVAELGEWLPKESIITFSKDCDGHAMMIYHTILRTAETEADCRAKMLIWLKETLR